MRHESPRGRRSHYRLGNFAKKQPRKLEDAVRRYCGREHSEAHGAAQDAAATVDVFLGQLQAHADLQAMDLAAIAIQPDRRQQTGRSSVAKSQTAVYTAASNC